MGTTTPRENALEGVILNLRRDLTQAKQQMAQLSDDLVEQKTIAGNWKFRASTALTRLAELTKQPIFGFHWRKGLEWGFSLTGDFRASDKSSFTPLFAAAGASPEPSALQAENAKLITALAECRDAFPIPDAGSDLDGWYVSAIADPLEVPEYVKACLAAGATPKPAQFNDATQLQIAYIKGLGDGALRPSQADAQRYRLLRSCRGMEHDPLLTVVHEIDGVLWGADLDDAVDAAINAKESK